MSIVRLIIEHNGVTITLRVVRTKDKDRFDFNFILNKAKVTITKRCEGLMEEDGVIDYDVLKEEVNNRIEEVYEMLME